MMRKKLLTTLALLLMAVSSAWADSYLYLEFSGTSATLKYGEVPAQCLYFLDGSVVGWEPNGYTESESAAIKSNCTTISVDKSCQNYAGTSLFYLFNGFTGLTTINNFGNLNTAHVTDMYGMFQGCSSLTTLDLRGWDTSNIDNMGSMFQGCSNLTTLNLSGWNTSSVENMSGMFYGCSELTTIYIDKNWSTASVTSSNYMFEGCTKLPNWDSDDPVTDASMAKASIDGGYLTTTESYLYLDINGTSATLKYGVVPDGKPYYPYYYGDSYPQWSGNGSDVFDSFRTNGTTINVDVSCKDYTGTTLQMLFFNCSKLTTINNLGNLKTDNVTNMEMVFFSCSSLTTLDLSGWKTANVTTMLDMFSGCSSLTTLDLSGWNTANVTDMEGMFSACENLTTIYVGDGWSTEKVTSSDGMFEGCTKLPNWDGTTDATHANTGAGGYLSVKVVGNSDGAGNYWATYYNGTYDFTADTKTTVYQAKLNSGKTAVVLTSVTGREVPKGNGVVLKSSATPITLNPPATAITTTLSDNELQGVDVATEQAANTTYYVLSKKGDNFGFFKLASGIDLGANKAYLAVVNNGACEFYGFDIDAETTKIVNTDITDSTDKGDGQIYDLQGRKVQKPVRGIYVKGGHKFIVK